MLNLWSALISLGTSSHFNWPGSLKTSQNETISLTPHTVLSQKMVCIDFLHGHHLYSIIFCLKKKNQFCWRSWHTCTSQLQSCFCTMLVTQSRPTLYDPMDCSPPGSSVHGDSPGKNTGTGCHALLQEVFWIQGSNPGLQRCKQIFYCLSYQGSPGILEWVAYPFSRGSSRPRDQTRVSCIAGGFFTSWAT